MYNIISKIIGKTIYDLLTCSYFHHAKSEVYLTLYIELRNYLHEIEKSHIPLEYYRLYCDPISSMINHEYYEDTMTFQISKSISNSINNEILSQLLDNV